MIEPNVAPPLLNTWLHAHTVAHTASLTDHSSHTHLAARACLRGRLLGEGGEHQIDEARLAVAHETEDADIAGAVSVAKLVDNFLDFVAYGHCVLLRVHVAALALRREEREVLRKRLMQILMLKRLACKDCLFVRRQHLLRLLGPLALIIRLLLDDRA